MTEANTNTAAAEEQTKIVVQLPEGFKNYAMEEFSFHFKKDRETDTKRPTVKLTLPVLTVDGVVDILESGDVKQIALLLSAANDVIIAQARGQVNDKEDIAQDNFDFAKISWETIANLPPAERRGGGISKETWEEFGKDYAVVMAKHADKDEEQIAKHLSILLSKMQKAKTNKPVLKAFQGFLAMYTEHTSQLEDFQECVDFLQGKIDTFVNLSEEELLANL